MQDVNELSAKNQAYESENKSLKQVIAQYKDHNESLSAHIQAYSQTVNEVVTSNIALKAGCSLLEKKVQTANQDGNNKDNELKAKDEEILRLTKKIEELETATPAKKLKSV